MQILHSCDDTISDDVKEEKCVSGLCEIIYSLTIKEGETCPHCGTTLGNIALLSPETKNLVVGRRNLSPLMTSGIRGK